MNNLIFKIKRILKNNKIVALLYVYFRVRLNHYEAIKANIRKFKDDNQFILNTKSIVSNDETIMIISQSDFIYSAKIELMLAFALKRMGWDIIFLVKRTSYWAIKLFKWSKIGTVVYFEDFFNNEIYKKSKIETKKYLTLKTDFLSVKEWRYKSSWIGPQILSTISRLQNQGMPNPESKKGRQILENILPEIISSIEISEKIYNSYKPNYCIVNEPNYDINGAMVDTLISNDVLVIHYAQPSNDNLINFFKLNKDSRRIHPSSITQNSFNKYGKFQWSKDFDDKLHKEFQNRYTGKYFLQSRNQPNIKYYTKDEILSHLEIKDISKKIVCIFSPVLWDANLFYGEDLFKDFEDWMIETLRAAIKNTNVIWFLKLHPANIWKLKRSNLDPNLISEMEVINKYFGSLPDHIKILKPDCGISTLGLFQLIDIGITVRGTVGMELPCFEKSTLTAGTGRYSQLGFTNDSSTKEEYLNKLAEIHNLEKMNENQILLAKKHAYLSFYSRGWKMETYNSRFMKFDTGSHPLDHDLELKSLSQNFNDLNLFANWIKSEDLDYFDLQNINNVK